MLAVGLGVSVLFVVLSEFNAYQKVSGRACWECTRGAALSGTGVPAGHESGVLWNFRLDFYQGTEIRRVDVAALGSQGPGISAPAIAAGARRVDDISGGDVLLDDRWWRGGRGAGDRGIAVAAGSDDADGERAVRVRDWFE